LLFYIGGNTLRNKPDDQPENAARIVHILSSGWDWMGEPMEKAQNINIPEVYHFGGPTHPDTLRALAQNLADVAAGVPVADLKEKPMTSLNEDAPMPRPSMNHTAQKPADPAPLSPEWEFLRPVSRLHMPAPLKKPAEPKAETISD
jgi:hypothetical protein